MKKTILFLSLALIFSSCSLNNSASNDDNKNSKSKNIESKSTKEKVSNKSKFNMLNASGKTIEERFLPPKGYELIKGEEGSFAKYLQKLPLKEDGSKVHYFDGREKGSNNHAAILDIDVGERDLQQCADAVIRLRSEYLYSKKEYNRIHYNFVSGFNAEYSKWIEGNRIRVDNNKSYWVKTSAYNADYKSFKNYLDMVYAYAGTESLVKELKSVPINEMQIGDVFINSGMPGHAITVVNMAIDIKSNKKVFMVAQSYMPAQDIHILKNYNNEDISPWYDLEFEGKLKTPEWTFMQEDLRRFVN